MISQDTKDQIKKEATEYSRRVKQESGIYTFKDCYTTIATNYAEKLEEKDKEIEEIRASRAGHVIEKFELQAKYNNLIDQLESKDHELAQLKEFQIWFYKKQFGFETDKSAQSNIDSDYAEWCKQNLK